MKMSHNLVAFLTGMMLLVPALQAGPGPTGADFIRPPRPPRHFSDLGRLSSASVDALARVFQDPQAARNLRQAYEKGGVLVNVTPVETGRSEAAQLVFVFHSTSSPLNPNPPPPWGAQFKATLFLPQDAGWQLGDVTELEWIAPAFPGL